MAERAESAVTSKSTDGNSSSNELGETISLLISFFLRELQFYSNLCHLTLNGASFIICKIFELLPLGP